MQSAQRLEIVPWKKRLSCPIYSQGKRVTEKHGLEIENRGRLKSHQDYADANGLLGPGMLPRRPLSLEPFFLKLDTWWWSISFSFSESCAGTYLTNKSCPAPSESVSPVSPVRRNRECSFPTRVGSVSAVCGMLSLRVSMQVDGRCATDGKQDVIFLP